MNFLRLFFAGTISFLVLAVSLLRASDEAPLPGTGFPGDRYASLWTKSPFAIATPDAPVASTDYQLVGVARFDGISYLSLIDKQSQEHFVVSSDHPFRDISVVSLTPGTNGAPTSAVVQRNGQPLTLTLEAVAPPSMGNPNMPPPMPMGMTGTMPVNNGSVGGMTYPSAVGGGPPPSKFRHRPIRFPPPPVP